MISSGLAVATVAALFATVPGGAVRNNFTPAAPAVSVQAANAAWDEARFITLINRERAARGIAALAVDPMLASVARAHSRDMADRAYFSHESPTPGAATPMARYQAAASGEPQSLLVGENLYYCSATVGAEAGHRALMASPGHRANLLDERYESIGVGIYANEHGEYWVTQVFLRRRD